MAYIYKITNSINNRVYVGQSNGANPKYYTEGTVIRRAIKKHGRENFTKTILIEGEFNQKLLNELETHYIRLYAPHGTSISYNILPGGENGVKGYKFTEEQIKRISEAHKGLPVTQEFRDKMSKIVKGRVYSQEAKDRMKEGSREYHRTHKKKPVSAETRQKISIAGKGRVNSAYNRLRTSERTSIPIIQFSLSGEFIKEWKSATEVRKTININHTHIASCCRGKRNSCGKFKWKYKKDYEQI